MAGNYINNYNEGIGLNKLDLYDTVKPPVTEFSQKMLEVNVTPSVELLYDDIFTAIREDDVPVVILKTVLEGFAEEQSSLKQLREKRSKEGKDTSHVSVKRSLILKYISDTLMQKQVMLGNSSGDLDLRGPRFNVVFEMLLKTIASTFDEVKVPVEYKEMFFNALSNNLEGWEERAEKLIKSMTPKIK